MAARLSSNLLWPLSRFSRIRSRSNALPSPSVIRPSRSITITPPMSRLFALRDTAHPSLSSVSGPQDCQPPRRLRVIVRPVSLGHDQFGAAALPDQNVKLIHKRLHQQDAAAGLPQHVLVHPRVGDLFDPKSCTLVCHANDHFFVQ